MTFAFLSVLRVSITAALVTVVVLLARLLLKGAPRWITCLMWMMVALRLVCPVLPQSELSFIPQEINYTENVYDDGAQVGSAFAFDDSDIKGNKGGASVAIAQNSADKQTQFADIGGYVWLFGASLMLLYGIASYIRTKHRFADAVLYKDNIRMSEKVSSPFVMGFLKPQIYIPFNLDRKTRKQVLLHEQAHIKRLDHIWKPLGYVLLCVHWFNPLLWVAYILFCTDVEVACDEKVIKDYKLRQKKAYAMALLKCRMPAKRMMVYPVAFGETSVGSRIKKTLRYRRPAAVIAVFALVLTASLSLCLLTDPIAAAEEDMLKIYSDGRVTGEYAEFIEAQTEPPTEPVTEPVTEPQTEEPTEPEQYYEYEDTYYSEDYYTEDNSDEYADDSSNDNSEDNGHEGMDLIVFERPELPDPTVDNPFAEANERAYQQRQTEYYMEKFSSFGNGNFNPFQPDLSGFESRNPGYTPGAPSIRWDNYSGSIPLF